MTDSLTDNFKSRDASASKKYKNFLKYCAVFCEPTLWKVAPACQGWRKTQEDLNWKKVCYPVHYQIQIQMQEGLPLATSLLSNTNTIIDKVCLASSLGPAHPDHPDNPEHFYYADHHDNLITPTITIIPVTRVSNGMAKWSVLILDIKRGLRTLLTWFTLWTWFIYTVDTD